MIGICVKEKCGLESDFILHYDQKGLISISLHMNAYSFQGEKKVDQKLDLLNFLLRTVCQFMHFGVHQPLLQTMLYAEFLFSLL